jgi:hypothetical protein
MIYDDLQIFNNEKLFVIEILIKYLHTCLSLTNPEAFRGKSPPTLNYKYHKSEKPGLWSLPLALLDFGMMIF